jgi:Winged helix DNA-binding domain
VDGFTRDRLMRALERRQVVKATLMRTTLHHVTSRDYVAYAGELFRRRISSLEAQLAGHPGSPNIDELVGQLLAHLTDGPRSRPELLELLGQPKLALDERRPWLVWHLLSVKAGLVHAPPSSRWRQNTGGTVFVPARAWLGAGGGYGDDAVVHLLRRYLAAFGPASRADVAQWTGLPVSAFEPAFARLRLRRFRDEKGRQLFDVPRAPLPPADTEAPPRFLPMWDSALLAHSDRTRILPEDYRKEIIRRNGDVQRTFLVDGFVAGVWRRDGGRIQLQPFQPLSRDARRALEAEAKALAAFHAE